MSPSSPHLMDTLHLLDHADRAKHHPCMKPEQLMAHLRSMSLELGTPLTDEAAAQAVATHVALRPRLVHPEGIPSSSQGKETAQTIHDQESSERKLTGAGYFLGSMGMVFGSNMIIYGIGHHISFEFLIGGIIMALFSVTLIADNKRKNADIKRRH